MMRALFVSLALVLAAVAVAVEGVAPVTTAAEADQQAALGLQVLQASDANPRQTVAAALAFTSALGFYKAQGDTDRVCELQASLYWCKKRMTLEDVQAFLVAKGQDEGLAKLAEQMATATATTVPKEEAAAYFSRAEKYAQQHPMDYLQVAIRYFEVADRFQGTDVSLTAQRRSLDAQRQAIQSDGSASKIAHELPAAVAVAGDLPPAAGKILSDFNAAAAIISKNAASEVAKEERRLTDSLGKDAESQQRQGNLEAMIASQRQMSNPDRDQTGLSKTAQSAVDSYRAARGKVIARAQESIAKEQAKVVRVLEGVQSDETKKGNVSGALAIKGKRDELSAMVEARKPTPFNDKELLTKYLLSTAWKFTSPTGSRPFRFGPAGSVLEGKNEFENTYSIDESLNLVFTQATGDVQSKFTIDKSTGTWNQTFPRGVTWGPQAIIPNTPPALINR